MKLVFVSRDVFSGLSTNSEMARYYLEVLDYLFVPEGGHDPIGALGAASMYDLMQDTQPTHIILPVGTGTTLAGILAAATPDIEVIAIPVLKGLNDMIERIKSISPKANLNRLSIWEDYHFGGYAKKTPELIHFMNQFYNDYQIPTDFVYTAKMMYGVMEKIKSGYFPTHSRIRCMHTGGLQGNLSLPKGTLCF
jgi:1-aminocyclopropane-1-carboxylate deaminase